MFEVTGRIVFVAFKTNFILKDISFSVKMWNMVSLLINTEKSGFNKILGSHVPFGRIFHKNNSKILVKDTEVCYIEFF